MTCKHTCIWIVKRNWNTQTPKPKNNSWLGWLWLYLIRNGSLLYVSPASNIQCMHNNHRKVKRDKSHVESHKFLLIGLLLYIIAERRYKVQLLFVMFWEHALCEVFPNVRALGWSIHVHAFVCMKEKYTGKFTFTLTFSKDWHVRHGTL